MIEDEIKIEFPATTKNGKTYVFIDSKKWALLQSDGSNIVITESELWEQMTKIEETEPCR